MDLRRKLNENPMITAAVVGVVLILGMWAIYHYSGSGPGRGTGMYYSVDNGASWFASSTEDLPPFDSGGKEAVRAHVYTCGEGGKEFVGYLEKYTPEARKVLMDFKSTREQKAEGPDMSKVQQADMRGRMVKKPEDKDWVSINDPRGRAIAQVKCPDGSPALPSK